MKYKNITILRDGTIVISGIVVGNLDLEKKVAHLANADNFMEKINGINLFKAGTIVIKYMDTVCALRDTGFSIVYCPTKNRDPPYQNC